MPLRKQNGLGKTGTTLSLCLARKNYTKIPPHAKKKRDWHTGKLRPLCLFVGTSEAFVYIWFRMLCISLGSAAVFDQVLIETCSNSCKCWTEGSSDSNAMMKLKSVSYYSKVLVMFNWYMIIICHFSQSFFQIKKTATLGFTKSPEGFGNTKGWSCINDDPTKVICCDPNIYDMVPQLLLGLENRNTCPTKVGQMIGISSSTDWVESSVKVWPYPGEQKSSKWRYIYLYI